MLLRILAMFSGPVAKILFARLAARLAEAEKAVKAEHVRLQTIAMLQHKGVERELREGKEVAIHKAVAELGF